MNNRYTIALLLVLGTSALAADWPRFLGPHGNSISSETGINSDWSTQPPKALWRVSMTDEGFSGPAIVGHRVYLHDHQGEEDVIRALDIETGKEQWHFSYEEPGNENDGFTRATPTIEDGYLYTISRTGVVHCLKAQDGSKVWRADVMQDHGGEPPKWGASNSAFIDGEQLITIGAGENSHVVALDKKTGKELWAGGGTDVAGYATPVVATLNGTRQYLIFTGKSIIGVNATDGKLHWRHPWKTRLDSNAGAPVVLDNQHVWIASGYRRGCALLKIDGGQVTEVWTDKRTSPNWSSAVLIDGYLYVTTMPGYLVCVEARTGKEAWRSKGTARGFEHGGLCAIDGTLIVIEGNTGNVVQVAISPEAYQELGRISPFGKSSRCWVAPVVAQKRLFVRSPEELVCLDISQ